MYKTDFCKKKIQFQNIRSSFDFSNKNETENKVLDVKKWKNDEFICRL